jgi:taurine dioxygenase
MEAHELGRSWTSEGRYSWRQLYPFGVELKGDLAAPMTPSERDLFRGLFFEHALLVAHDQQLSPETQSELSALIGPLLVDPGGPVGLLTTDEGERALREFRSTVELTFHSDLQFSPCPHQMICLHALDVVDGASSTRFADARRAFETLPADLQRRVDALRVDVVAPTLRTFSQRAMDAQLSPKLLRTVHPCVRRHWKTGRPYLTPSEMYAVRFLDMTEGESRTLLEALFDHIYAPRNVHEHSWRTGDVVLWDNIALQHARGDLGSVGRRTLQRTTVGEKTLHEMYPEMAPLRRRY